MSLYNPDTIYVADYDGREAEYPTRVYKHNGQRVGTNYMGTGTQERVYVDILEVDHIQKSESEYLDMTIATLYVYLPDVDRYAIFTYDYQNYKQDGYMFLALTNADFILDMPQ